MRQLIGNVLEIDGDKYDVLGAHRSCKRAQEEAKRCRCRWTKHQHLYLVIRRQEFQTPSYFFR